MLLMVRLTTLNTAMITCLHTATFNSTVHGTLSFQRSTEPETYDTTIVPETISHGQTIVNNSVTDTSIASTLSSTSAVHTSVTSNPLLYVVLGAAGGILILLLIIPILCGVAYWLATGKSCHSTSTAAQVEIGMHNTNCSVTVVILYTCTL